jgi:hypothetical protein
MEFFIPGLMIFLLAIIVTFLIAPRFTPLVISLLSLGFLTYGVYDHYKMFASEYRLSTWQDSLKIYAPALMIAAIIIFIIFSILSFFTNGSVPVPPIPNIMEPNKNTAAGTILDGLNKITNTITGNNNNNIVDNVNKQIDNINKNRTNLFGLNNKNDADNTATNNKNKKNNVITKSFLETI